MPSDLNGHIEKGLDSLATSGTDHLIAILRHIKAKGWPKCESPKEYPNESDGRSWAIQQACEECPPCRLNQLVSEKGERE